MVLHNPNNWHWVNKPCLPWAKEWLGEELPKISAEDGKLDAKVKKVSDVTGDVDVSQRKGKVITYFDVAVSLDWEGTAEDGEKVDGTIKIPEVAHDTEEDEYIFEIDVKTDNPSKDKLRDLIKQKLVPAIRKTLQQLAPALIAEHGKDIQHAAPTGSSSKPQPSLAPITSTNTSSSSTSTSVNTTSLTSNEEFRTSAEQLQQVFTNPDMITAFTRARPKVWKGSAPGDDFVIFDGNVEGSFVSVNPTEIVQKWRLKQWPAGHFSTLNMKFDQNNSEGVTMLRMKWDGVPVGQEEVTKRNWDEYYVKSIKICFGFGTVL